MLPLQQDFLLLPLSTIKYINSYFKQRRVPLGSQMDPRRTRKSASKLSAAINSAALQDHLLRQMNLKVEFGLKPVPKRETAKLPALNRSDKQITELQRKEKLGILPYESEALRKLKEAKSDEVKMRNYNKKLTWAQKLGIVEAPPLPLTAADWQRIEGKSKARNDSQNCCSICLDNFTVEPQVILSCSHVFHAQCLHSYEKHNRVKCCPICRRKDYEKKLIDEALRAFTLRSILRIQRTFRGSRVRISVLGGLCKQGYKASSARFNRRLVGFRMWRLSQRIVEKCKASQQHFTKILGEMQKQHEEEKQALLSDLIAEQRKRLVGCQQIQDCLRKFGIKPQLQGPSAQVDWEIVKAKGVDRQDQACSICLMALWAKPVYILSCTHLFHANCIEGFERYSLAANSRKCPCCRAEYEKRLVKQ